MFNISIIAIVFVVAAISFLIFQIATNSQRKVSLPRKEIVLAGQVFSVEVADTALSRANGLSWRSGLGEGDGSTSPSAVSPSVLSSGSKDLEPNGSPRRGMLFIFGNATTQSFWMKDMNFPIDIIWIKGNRIVGFAENAEPEPGKKLWELKIYSSPEPVDKVLEVSAGMVAKLGIKIGDEVLSK